MSDEDSYSPHASALSPPLSFASKLQEASVFPSAVQEEEGFDNITGAGILVQDEGNTQILPQPSTSLVSQERAPATQQQTVFVAKCSPIIQSLPGNCGRGKSKKLPPGNTGSCSWHALCEGWGDSTPVPHPNAASVFHAEFPGQVLTS